MNSNSNNNNNNYSDDEDDGEAFPSAMVTASPRRQRQAQTVLPTSANDYGDEDSNDPMQPPLRVHNDDGDHNDAHNDDHNEDKQDSSWYSCSNFNCGFSYVCGHRRLSRLYTTAAACAFSTVALMIGLVLLVLSVQAGQQRDINEAAASNSNDSIIPSRPPQETAILQQEFWALYNLVRMRDTTDNVADNGTNDDDPYANFVLSGSPQWRAVEWLLSEDPAQLLSGIESSNTADPLPTPSPASVARLKQRYALAVIYFHYGGKAWNLPAGAGWLSDTTSNVVMDECDWVAVVCSDDNDGFVTALELGPEIPMRMAGVLPSELGLLTALTTLDLADKDITGTIPLSIYHSLTKLRYLDIGLNRLVSLSPDIAQWDQLQTLIVANNKLYGTLPTELFTLTDLQVLYLQNNPMASGPLLESVGSWPVMELLDVSFTNISGTLSAGVGQLTSLQQLGAASLPLSGSLPDEISNCTALKQLSIGYILQDGLHGTIPKSLGLLTNLEGLAFPQAGFTGTLPTELGLLTNLLFLDLAGMNALTGSIPSEIGLLTDLILFKAFGTALSGSIPTEMGRATNLEAVQIQETQLTGSIPASLCALSTAGTLEDLSAQCKSDNSTGIPAPAQVECDCRCTCSL
jgi:hypothetical protein